MENLESITNGTSVLSNLQPLMDNLLIISIISGGLILVLYIINVVRRMRADRAMIAMHKDIAAIRELLEHQQSSPPPSVPTPAEQPITPTRDESESSLTT